MKIMSELTAAERKQLRMARFGAGTAKMPGMQEASTTIEALKLIEEQKRKKLERAERFGLITEELTEKRIKQRQERFGILTKESIDAKKQERMKRFAVIEETTKVVMTADDLEAKRKARVERFGTNTELRETQRNVTD